MFNFQKEEINNLERACKDIIEDYKRLTNENQEMKKQIKKDYDTLINEKIVQLEKDIKYYQDSRIFNITPSQAKTIQNFRLKHNHSATFTFEEGGDGLISYLSCKCCKCNEEIVIYF